MRAFEVLKIDEDLDPAIGLVRPASTGLTGLAHREATHNHVDASYAKKAKLHVTPETASVQAYVHLKLNCKASMVWSKCML